MTAIIIDTNVLLVADGKASQLSAVCVEACLDRLEQVRAKEQIVLDDAHLILNEYLNKLSPNSSQTYGSAFLKWLLQNQGNDKHVTWVTISPTNQEKTLFREFPPDKELEGMFDPADRKFVATSYAHPKKPPILESADSKWLGWEDRLKAHGVKVEFLCRGELEKIRAGKDKETR